ncbi:MAG TPA: amino acid adenylation domain-containing protein, partial [Candidatus Polarisedimenticolia bacterium]|nr:amino acid adenylation domain-containing protein [Candidatus Polarisedimenticolia bacterium]
WFLDQLQPGGSAYNVASALRLRGALDAAALSRAVDEVERRHEAQRTRFVSGPRGPEAIVQAPREGILRVEDVSGLEDPAAEASRRARRDAGRPFDLEAGPLWRARLLRCGPAEHVLALVLHHIVTDEWSMDLLARELAALYGAFADGLQSPLPELTLQYADWAAWQRRWLEGGEMRRQIDWWRERLEGVETLDLPTDRPRPARRGLREGSVSFHLPEETASALARGARDSGATLFHALLACFHALLARQAGSDDVVVGTAVANRTVAEAQGLIGFFANTLPLRLTVDPRATLLELLSRARETTLDALARQDAPFEAIVESIDPPRDLGRNPIFDCLFVLRHAGRPVPSGALFVEPIPAETGSTPFDLSLVMAESEGRIFGSLLYDADLFEPATIHRLVSRYRMLAEAMALRPQTVLGEIDLRSPEERAAADRANDTLAPRPETTLHELVLAQALKTPDLPAVVGEDGQLTYAELAERAGRLAARLVREGAGPERGVALLAGRTLDAVAGMLGVLASGAALVPLEPTVPPARMKTMLDAAGVLAVVCERGMQSALPPEAPPVIFLDEALRDEEADLPAPPCRLPRAAASVLFTSGSTGEPKGVITEHRSIADRTITSAQIHRLGPGQRVLWFHSLLFDATFDDVFPSLCSGATVVIHPDPRGEGPEELMARCRRHGVTTVFIPVGVFHALAAEAEAGLPIPVSLREITTGGERPSASRAAALLGAASGRLSVNHIYGPTETSVFVTSWQLSSSRSAREPLPLGFPLANTTLHIVDRLLRPVAEGALGEIAVGGIGVARGYAGRPAATAERFVPDPFSGEPGARLYLTGDLGRRLPGGEIAFHGRRDGQVKLRGHRIELGEIEAALLRAPGVREAAVLVRGEGAAARLTAFVTATGSEPPDPAALRASLRASLPGYMVPEAIVALDEMPRTPTGKVARRLLPEPGRATAARPAVAPRDDLERAVASAWRTALGRDDAGEDIEEGFFEAGGNSLLAVRLVTALRRTQGIDLPVAAVFTEPTIAGLARMARCGGAPPEPDPLVTLRHGEGLAPVVCFHGVGGGVSDFAELASCLDPRRLVLGLHALHAGAPAGIEEAAERSARVIARRLPQGPLTLVGWSYGGLVAYETALRLAEAGRAIAALILIDVPAPGGEE